MKKSGIIISQNPNKALPTAATGNTDFMPASCLRFAVARYPNTPISPGSMNSTPIVITR